MKLYKTVVSIDEPVEGLKPGMSAEVTVYAEESPTDVLVVPGAGDRRHDQPGGSPSLFCACADGPPERRDIVVGMSNQRVVEVRSGSTKGKKSCSTPIFVGQKTAT